MSKDNEESTWDARYLSGDTPWDKGIPHPAIETILSKIPHFTRALAPGCGRGHDVRELAKRNVPVVGLDVSPEGISRAKQFARVGNEEYALTNFFELPDNYRSAFDLLFEHTCFCAIDPCDRDRYVRSVEYALKPGGIFAAIFYKNPDMDPGETGPPFGVSNEELNQRFDPSFTLLEAWIPEKTFPGREGREECRIYRRK